MNNFENKIKRIAGLRDELDKHIWETFSKYIKIKRINFNGPEDWTFENGGNCIWFNGSDGCLGCYDNISLSIPMKYFTDPTAFDRLEQEIANEKEAKDQARIKAQEDKDRKEYARLKKQFEG